MVHLMRSIFISIGHQQISFFFHSQEKHNILLSLTRHPFLLHPREFQKLWLSKDNPVMLEYVEKALWGAIIRKTCQLYPLIFSNAYVKVSQHLL